MSERVVELRSQGSRASAPEFERTPPQDIAAEQSVLGGMLLSKDAIADVVEVVRASDFYKPAHQTIFDVVVDLYGKGEPADPITVSAELTRTARSLGSSRSFSAAIWSCCRASRGEITTVGPGSRTAGI